jgi:Cu2+-exporting ATPase
MMFGLGFNRVRAAAPPPSQAAAVAAAPPCFHCGLPAAAPVADWLLFDAIKRPMCCAACLAAAEMIIGAGFGGHYRAQADAAAAAALATATEGMRA